MGKGVGWGNGGWALPLNSDHATPLLLGFSNLRLLAFVMFRLVLLCLRDIEMRESEDMVV